MKTSGGAAVRDRNSGKLRHRNAGGNSRHDRIRDSVLLKFTTVECVLVLPALIRVHNQTLYRRKSFKRFIQHILDLFPIEMYKEKRIRRFEMAYVAESYYGDELTLFMDDAGEGVYDVEVKKNGSEVVCRSKVMFTEK